MPSIEAFVREAGRGPAVVCLHANASSSSQWRGLLDQLSPTHHVLAPDLYGAGKSPDWPSDRVISLADEADLVEPVLARAAQPLVLVGHSHGAAVALLAALRQPARVRALVLYEPTLFALVDAHQPAPNGADGIRHAAAAAAAALDGGDAAAAAECFIDYWMGAGSWRQMPAPRQAPIAESVRNVRRWAHALFTEPTPLAAFGALTMPVLLMTGGRSPESAQAVVRLLQPVLPRVRLQRFSGLGHMGPVTHPEIVNAAMRDFIAANS
jgi:pimeloyl-ACP methyl ester carboxylesterase